ncbi:CLUMA_CG001656, isoform A [Clunio marinus]|uniref:CLUMA_CG001656, isoform A n=1 Tax=Clunio marinus TaxID=568069 RepID=A0A1J1HIN1_9DIPT|nr:CLUMA_CG001656, isoform A [Clunio marinus]
MKKIKQQQSKFNTAVFNDNFLLIFTFCNSMSEAQRIANDLCVNFIRMFLMKKRKQKAFDI